MLPYLAFGPATMFFSSKTIYLLVPSPNHKHELRIGKGQNLLITNHLDQSNISSQSRARFELCYGFCQTSAYWIKMLSHSHFVELFRQIFIDLHPNYVVQCVGGDVLITQIFLLMFHLSLSILFLPFELGHTSQSIDNRTNQPIDLLGIKNQYCSSLWM